MLSNLRDETFSALGGRSTTASNSPMPGDYLAAADEGDGCGMCNFCAHPIWPKKKENQTWGKSKSCVSLNLSEKM